ncbi:MAG: hypothetical protein IJS88_05725 [Alphaproteobacteria bacterium]|nr:hypothetical protein [Alphaproteobacteria bacterium]
MRRHIVNLWGILFLSICGYIVPVVAQEADLAEMLKGIEIEDDEAEIAAKNETNIENQENLPAELGNKTDDSAPQSSDTLQSAQNTVISNDVEAEAKESEADISSAEEETEIQVEVFEPEFMDSLLACHQDNQTKDGITLEIIGMQNEKCIIKYGNYYLNVPTSLLANIHSFDDLEILLKNKDIADYKYFPKYVYNGLIYALNACANQQEYLGLEEHENFSDAVATRGLSAEYKNNLCMIYLENELDLELEGSIADYGYTCVLSPEVVAGLPPYFADIIAANKESEDIDVVNSKEVQDADIALMYYMQQNGYCSKNR